MKRREALKRTAMIMGYAVSASAMAGVMSGCQADTKTPAELWKAKALSDTQINTLREAAERIVPATEGIVGAKDVKVERFIDEMCASYFEAEETEAFKKGIDALEADAQATHNKTFADLEPAQMDGLITKIMNEAVAKKDEESEIEPFFFALKGATLLGFFSSEEVGENVLNYDPIPGDYQGCVPMSEIENGRLWSL